MEEKMDRFRTYYRKMNELKASDDIRFPSVEIPMLEKRVADGKNISTVRVSNDVNRYHAGQIVHAPQLNIDFKILDSKLIKNISEYKFFNELTKQQIISLKQYDRFNVLELQPIKTMVEAHTASMGEYEKYFDQFYKPRLPKDQFDYLKRTSKQSEEYVGLGNFKVEESDSGNLIVKWAEKGNTIYIVGILSKSGHVLKADVEDLNDWLYKLIEYLYEGKTIVTSPNEISMMLLDRVKKQLAKDGKEMTKNPIGPSLKLKDDPLFKWQSYEIRLKN
jgi:ASC-1-like (ASCH) protein